jgi:hypothetical protein
MVRLRRSKIRQSGSLCLIRARAMDEGRGTVREGTNAVRIEGLSKRAVARRFGIDPRTVDKMLEFLGTARLSAVEAAAKPSEQWCAPSMHSSWGRSGVCVSTVSSVGGREGRVFRRTLPIRRNYRR